MLFSKYFSNNFFYFLRFNIITSFQPLPFPHLSLLALSNQWTLFYSLFYIHTPRDKFHNDCIDQQIIHLLFMIYYLYFIYFYFSLLMCLLNLSLHSHWDKKHSKECKLFFFFYTLYFYWRLKFADKRIISNNCVQKFSPWYNFK